ncbi:unnamed protein product, partial [Mesorhabditis spiculigera]
MEETEDVEQKDENDGNENIQHLELQELINLQYNPHAAVVSLPRIIWARICWDFGLFDLLRIGNLSYDARDFVLNLKKEFLLIKVSRSGVPTVGYALDDRVVTIATTEGTLTKYYQHDMTPGRAVEFPTGVAPEVAPIQQFPIDLEMLLTNANIRYGHFLSFGDLIPNRVQNCRVNYLFEEEGPSTEHIQRRIAAFQPSSLAVFDSRTEIPNTIDMGDILSIDAVQAMSRLRTFVRPSHIPALKRCVAEELIVSVDWSGRIRVVRSFIQFVLDRIVSWTKDEAEIEVLEIKFPGMEDRVMQAVRKILAEELQRLSKNDQEFVAYQSRYIDEVHIIEREFDEKSLFLAVRRGNLEVAQFDPWRNETRPDNNIFITYHLQKEIHGLMEEYRDWRKVNPFGEPKNSEENYTPYENLCDRMHEACWNYNAMLRETYNSTPAELYKDKFMITPEAAIDPKYAEYIQDYNPDVVFSKAVDKYARDYNEMGQKFPDPELYLATEYSAS